jgi:phage terminase large subunit
MEVRVKKIDKIYDPSINATTRYVLSEGGTRSGKTYTTNQVLYTIAAQSPKPVIISVVSETMPHLKRGAMRDFFLFITGNNLYVPSDHNKTDNTYKVGKSFIEFFSADSPDKVHGPERDYLFVNEVQNIAYEIFFHLAQRTRIRIFADWNPTHELFIHTKILNDPQYKDDYTYIHSTIHDNPFVSEEIKKDVLRRANVDGRYRTVYLEGRIGIREGLVFERWQQVDKLPEGSGHKIRYGLDFGYTNDPTALIKVVETDGGFYLDELIYETGMLSRDIAGRMSSLLKKNYDLIMADSADPRLIDELRQYGYNIKPSIKGADSILIGIDKLKSKPLHVTKRSINLIRELRNYTYETNNDGQPTNKPVDAFNHAIDAARYAISEKERTTSASALQGVFY